jgi:hypothetical protein
MTCSVCDAKGGTAEALRGRYLVGGGCSAAYMRRTGRDSDIRVRAWHLLLDGVLVHLRVEPVVVNHKKG